MRKIERTRVIVIIFFSEGANYDFFFILKRHTQIEGEKERQDEKDR